MRRTKCVVCRQCWLLPIGVCIYGGPFGGYEREKEDGSMGVDSDSAVLCTPSSLRQSAELRGSEGAAQERERNSDMRAGGKATMTWKPDIVLYHGGCNDGFGAAWACWKKWGGSHGNRSIGSDEVMYMPAQYGMDVTKYIKGLNVLMVDWSMKRGAMIEAAKIAKSIVVLDHHKTAQAELAEWAVAPAFPMTIEGATEAIFSNGPSDLETHPELRIAAYFDMEKSGARLAWEFCFPGEEIPMMLAYIEDRDLWRQPPRHSETWAFTKALSSYPQTFEAWAGIAGNEDVYVEEGEAILRYHDKMVADACQYPRMLSVAGHTVPVVNVPYFLGSDSAAFLLKMFPDAPFAGYYFHRADGSTQWGLRSEDHRLDCSEIAKKFGGGGHRNAAGFTVPGA